MSVHLTTADLEKATNAPGELSEELNYGNDEQWQVGIDKVRPRKYLDEEFEKCYESICSDANCKDLAKRMLPILQKVLQFNQDGKSNLFKANELMETLEPAIQYCYTAEEYQFLLEERCRQLLHQYDSTFKEVIVARTESAMEQCEEKTTQCFYLLEEGIKAADGDVSALQQEIDKENGRIEMNDIDGVHKLAIDVIDEENEELELIKDNCDKDLNDIDQKWKGVEYEMKKVCDERERQQKKLKVELNENTTEQRRLEQRLKELREREQELKRAIAGNDQIQRQSNEGHGTCKGAVDEMERRIRELLDKTISSKQLMTNMKACVELVTDCAKTEKNRLAADIKQKQRISSLQLRDALMAKAVLHKIRIDELTLNIKGTKQEIVDAEREKVAAAKAANAGRVNRVKEKLVSIREDEAANTAKKQEHELKLEEIKGRLEHVAIKLPGRLVTLETRVKEWKAEQDKCFDDPNTAHFSSIVSQQ